MSRLIGRLSLIPMPSGGEWIVQNELQFLVDLPGRPCGWQVIVESGFITDLASRPWIMALLLDRWGKHGVAAVLHDWLYWTQICTRAEADDAMRTIMIASGVPAWKARAIWAALRAGGWVAWNGNAKRRAAGEDHIFRGDLDRLAYLAESA